MASTSVTRIRRDAGASVFAYGMAAIALVGHVVTSVGDRWSADVLTLDVEGRDGRRRTLLVDVADVPGWAVTTLRASDVMEWVAGAAVLVMLTACVVRMIRGKVFTRSTARWATWASWTTLVLLVVPTAMRHLATNMALQSAAHPDRWDPDTASTQWWYLYVGMMTLSFLALVLRRGSQLQDDQEGLI